MNCYLKNYESFISDLFNYSYELKLEKIKETNEKTPDFYCYYNNEEILICELKTFEYEKPSIGKGWKKEFGFWTREDNAVSRVSDKINKSYKQLINFNLPKMLILLNNSTGMDVKDLYESLTGNHKYSSDDGSFSYYNNVSLKISEGRIKYKKNKIDLYMWIDVDIEEPTKCYFVGLTKIGDDIYKKYFNKDF